MKKQISLTLMASMMTLTLAACAPAASTTTTGAAAGAGTSAASQAAKVWPASGIELVVPLKAGGDTDFYARTYAKYLEKELGQTVTVINVEGAGGTVGAQQVASAKPDGNTVLFYHTGNMYTNKLTGTTELDHNSFDVAAAAVLDDTNVLVAGKDSGFTDGKDFLAKAKANPNKYNVATTISGFSYFVTKKAENVGGFKLNPVDVGSASAMVPSILGGQTELAMNSYGVFKQYIENKDVIPLMVFAAERNPNFKDVPTAKELGVDAVAARTYFFAFPKGTDPAYVKELSNAVGKIQTNPEYAKEISTAYMVQPFYVAFDKVKAYLDGVWTDMEKYKDQLNNK